MQTSHLPASYAFSPGQTGQHSLRSSGMAPETVSADHSVLEASAAKARGARFKEIPDRNYQKITNGDLVSEIASPIYKLKQNEVDSVLTFRR